VVSARSTSRRFLLTLREWLLLALLGGLGGWFWLNQVPDELALEGKHEEPPAALRDVVLERVASDLDKPLQVVSPPRDERRLFIVEKTGRVKVLEGGKVRKDPFVDLARRVSLRGEEQGLLSLAFHPKYAENGRFFVNFTDSKGDTRVVEMRVRKDDPYRADPATERQVLQVDQPFSNHNGGLAIFGPDGYLYVGLGDGGAAGDPFGNAQDLGTLLGKILRIDVDGDGRAPYRIPASNPFVGQRGARGEIWAYGLRNPWRFNFDRETGDLYIADVGQNKFEEVSVQPRASKGGENYGWDIVEGLGHCFTRRNCDQTGLTQPLVEYGHDVGLSISGGAVYRGREIPALRGHYFYADYVTGVIRSFRYADGKAEDRYDWTKVLNPYSPETGKIGTIASIDEDARGEVYIVDHHGGAVYRLARKVH